MSIENEITCSLETSFLFPPIYLRERHVARNALTTTHRKNQSRLCISGLLWVKRGQSELWAGPICRFSLRIAVSLLFLHRNLEKKIHQFIQCTVIIEIVGLPRNLWSCRVHTNSNLFIELLKTNILEDCISSKTTVKFLGLLRKS